MRKEDLPQVSEIDREAFPTQWPPPDYRPELENPLARHLVVCDTEKTAAEPEFKASSPKGVSRLAAKVRQWLRLEHRFNNKSTPFRREYVVGLAAIWVMADEAHLTNVAVRKCYQRQGIGELLLLSIIDLAAELKAKVVTLEVRVSNITAQNLYQKYGFTQVGVRPGYYTDNKEDALLMSTESITSAPFQVRLQRLKRTHLRRYGNSLAERILTR